MYATVRSDGRATDESSPLHNHISEADATVELPSGGASHWESSLVAVVVATHLQLFKVRPLADMRVRWTQWGLDRAVRSLLPREWTDGFQLLVLEDIVDAAPFTLYPEYMERRQLTADCELRLPSSPNTAGDGGEQPSKSRKMRTSTRKPCPTHPYRPHGG